MVATDARVVIATPMRDGMVSGVHHASTWEVVRGPVEIIDPKLLLTDSIVLARSRAVRLFLQKTEGTHLLFWDADVEGSAEALEIMLGEGLDYIAATYPKKHLDPDGQCRDFALYTRGETVAFEGNHARVAGVGLGFTLLTRQLLSQMWLQYEDELHAYDDGDRYVALFAQVFAPNSKGLRVHYPEDYSFCSRLPPSCPVALLTTHVLAHHGQHLYRSTPGALWTPREPAP